LQQAPPLDAILGDILPILTGSSTAKNYSINALMEQLRQKRCLLILTIWSRFCKGEIAADNTNKAMKITDCYLRALLTNPTKVL
jgi:hypothetical protein